MPRATTPTSRRKRSPSPGRRGRRKTGTVLAPAPEPLHAIVDARGRKRLVSATSHLSLLPTSPRMTSFNELAIDPVWSYLADNPAIHTSYRYGLNPREAFGSLWRLHNE